MILLGGSLDIYSIMVEYEVRGELLTQRFIEHHGVFVIVSLIAGLSRRDCARIVGKSR